MKLCECGCGKPTKLEPQSVAARGIVKGQPKRFLSGHNWRMSLRPRQPMDLAVRFWRHVKKTDGCWEWIGKRHRCGYGVIQIGGKKGPEKRTHRIAWELSNGPIPPGLMVLHKCDNRPCVNPSHLYLGTAKDNMRDTMERGPYSPPPLLKSKLTAARVSSIRARFNAGGITKKELARISGLSETHLSRVLVKDLTWA